MSEDTNPKEKKEGRVRRWLGRSALVLLALFAGVCVWAYFAWDVADWQGIDPNKITNLQQTTLLYDSNGELLTSVRAIENRTVIPLSSVPVHVRDAFLAAEDLRFYTHPGIDFVRIAGAMVSNFRSGSYIEGASTITQQLIKLSHLTEAKTMARKMQEAYLALQLERGFSKDQILEMYLNFVNFGGGAYGLQAAAKNYFGVDAQDLTVAQGAALAATIKAPSAFSVRANPDNNKVRRNYIIDTMLREGMIDEAAATKAKETTLTALERIEEPRPYGWFVDGVLNEAEKVLGIPAEAVLGSGHHIYTTLDRNLQDIADGLYAQSRYFPPNARDGVSAQSAFTAVDVRTGALRAVVGGRTYTTQRGLNRALDMRRSPGSAIKPLAVYGPALEQGYSAASVLLDEFGDFNGYKPQNAGNTYYGPVTMRYALARSLNVSTVRLLKAIGIPASRAYLEKVNIPLHARDQNLAIGLGALTTGVTPLEMAAAYVPFANGGMYHAPYTIERIEDSQGRTVYEHKTRSHRVTSEQNAYLMTSMLLSAVTSGTGSRLTATGQQVAAKTGTNSLSSGGNRDVWICAYTPDLSLSVWMGFDQTDSTHRVASGSTGGDLPAGLATAFIQAAYRGKTKPTFNQPKGLVWLEIDRESIYSRGFPMLASKLTPKSYRYNEVFLETNRPTRYSDVWHAPEGLTSFVIDYGDDGKPLLVLRAADTARYRIQRDSPGESVILAELRGNAGETLYFTDTQAQYGVTYTYRVTPVHEELLAEGVLLEGRQAVLVAQARAPAAAPTLPPSFPGNIVDFFTPPAQEEPVEEQAPEPVQVESSMFH
ncbi:MAG: PBP1A family penicillin-binding protein [Clostridia bacterium]|nr:PBP1A family penicillin-binding protein [Clostridia bacterium]